MPACATHSFAKLGQFGDCMTPIIDRGARFYELIVRSFRMVLHVRTILAHASPSSYRVIAVRGFRIGIDTPQCNAGFVYPAQSVGQGRGVPFREPLIHCSVGDPSIQ